MSKLKDILLRTASLATLLVFFFSTTGFVMHIHICDHHEQHYSLTQFDECCESEPVVETSGCCAEVTTCSTSDEDSNCCEEDQSYYKLSNWYVPNEKKVSTTDCPEQVIIICKFEEVGQQEEPKPTREFTTKKKKPDPRKYRLYNRVKIDPPLI